METLNKTISFIIYKVTAPNGKVYIGQTRQGLKRRKRDHIYKAKNSLNLFAKALVKYKDKMLWEILEQNIDSQSYADDRETFWISHFKSNDKKLGYNLTEGGYGGERNEESEIKRIKAVKKAFSNNPKISKRSSEVAKNLWQTRREEMISSIKAARSTKESKELTRRRSKERKRTKESSQNISKGLKSYYEDPSNKKKTSTCLLKAHAKPFVVIKDGIEVYRFENKATASKKLGICQPNISSVLAGKRKSAGGYVFRYISESIDPQTGGLTYDSSTAQHEHEEGRTEIRDQG